MQRCLRSLWLAALVALCLSCGRTPTQVLVVIDSELNVAVTLVEVTVRLDRPLPMGLPAPPPDQVYSIITPDDVGGRPDQHTLPLSFAVVPEDGDASRRALVEVVAIVGISRERLVKRASFAFTEGEQRGLAIVFEQACMGVDCLTSETCEAGTCVDPATTTVAVSEARERFGRERELCEDADDCGDGNGCTNDRCDDGACVYTPVGPDAVCGGDEFGPEIRYCGDGKCRVRMLASGRAFTCALANDRVRCDGPPEMTGSFAVPNNEAGEQIAAGADHACLLSDGTVRCWGDNALGQVGVGEVSAVSIAEPPRMVPVGMNVAKIAAGLNHTCALADGAVRCWGANESGQLGQDVSDVIGAPPSEAVALGGRALDIAAGDAHTCALLDDGNVACWGESANGRLGRGTRTSMAEIPAVSLGVVDADAITVGGAHSCARQGAEVRCWGSNANGRLGIGDTRDVGEAEAPIDIRAVRIPPSGGIFAARNSTCALDGGAQLRCWGEGRAGALASQSADDVGDSVGEIEALLPLPLDFIAHVYASASSERVCALLFDGSFVCWGALGTMDGVGNEPGELPEPFAFADDGELCIHETNCLSGTCTDGRCAP